MLAVERNRPTMLARIEPQRPAMGPAQAEARSMKRGGSGLPPARYNAKKRG
jgi:hypothetical protein